MKRRIWPLVLAAIFGAVFGSASMAFYLYAYQAKVENNAAQIQRQEKRIERLERPAIKRPTYEPKNKWWEIWRR